MFAQLSSQKRSTRSKILRVVFRSGHTRTPTLADRRADPRLSLPFVSSIFRIRRPSSNVPAQPCACMSPPPLCSSRASGWSVPMKTPRFRHGRLNRLLVQLSASIRGSSHLALVLATGPTHASKPLPRWGEELARAAEGKPTMPLSWLPTTAS